MLRNNRFQKEGDNLPPKTKYTREEIVLAALALTRERGFSAVTARGLAAEVAQIAVSRTRPVGQLHLLMANNPVFLITGERR